MPKAAGMQLLTSDSEQPRRTSPFWVTRGLDDDSVCRAGPPIAELPGLSNGQREKSQPARLWRIREKELLAAREAHFVARNES
jgi:hypothetical protein